MPDIRWRAHLACWAGENALRLAGDFVECGVHTGLLSIAVCEYLDFAATDKKFWLFDTFKGIPDIGLTDKEKAHVKDLNEGLYFDVLGLVERNFAPYPNANIVPGILPETLEKSGVDRVSYLSVDLNNSPSEKAVIDYLWDKLSTGAMVIIDDYAHTGFESQFEMWSKFASDHNRTILTFPTGQGLLLK